MKQQASFLKRLRKNWINVLLLVLAAGFIESPVHPIPQVQGRALVDTVSTLRVSLSSTGEQATGGASYEGAISADGRYVVFTSSAPNLVSGYSYDSRQVFLRDLQTNQTSLISLTSSNQPLDYDATFATLSGNGQFVLFGTGGAVTENCTGSSQVYVRDLINSTTTCVSVSSEGVQGNWGSYAGAISWDGRYVVFSSDAFNLVPGDVIGCLGHSICEDVFLHDRQTGETARISYSPFGEEANADSSDPFITPNGRYITFTSQATNLVIDDTNGGYADVFVYDRTTGSIVLESRSSDGSQGSGDAAVSNISEDGRYLAFASRASMGYAGTGDYYQIYLRDRLAGTTTLVSASPIGVPGATDSYTPMISPDGRYVVYSTTASNIVIPDINGCHDVFLYDRLTGVNQLVSINSAGVQANNASSLTYGTAITPGANKIVFSSVGNNLVVGDTNGLLDVFVQTRLVSDTIPPSAITDLFAAAGAYPGDINLSWSAPGDDGDSGLAASYDIRYSTSPITTSNWASASLVTGEPIPESPGTIQSTTVRLRPNTLFYFAIRTRDDANLESPLSNVPSRKAPGILISDINAALKSNPNSVLNQQVTVVAIAVQTNDWTGGLGDIKETLATYSQYSDRFEILKEYVSHGGWAAYGAYLKAKVSGLAVDVLLSLRSQVLWGMHPNEYDNPMLLMLDPASSLLEPGVPYVLTGYIRKKSLNPPYTPFYYLEVINPTAVTQYVPTPTDPHNPLPAGYTYQYWWDVTPYADEGSNVCTIAHVVERYMANEKAYVSVRLMENGLTSPRLYVRVNSTVEAPDVGSLALFCGTERVAAVGESIYDGYSTEAQYLNTTEQSGMVRVITGRSSVIQIHEMESDLYVVFSTGSPVDLHIYDAAGKHVGAVYDGGGNEIGYDLQISGAYAFPGADSQPEVIVIPRSGGVDYDVTVRGTDSGTYTYSQFLTDRAGKQVYIQEIDGINTQPGQEDYFFVNGLPPAPSGLEIVRVGSEAWLEWELSNINYFDGYYVYQGTPETGFRNRLNGFPLQTAQLNLTIPTDQQVCYAVSVVNTDGVESGLSDLVCNQYFIHLPMIRR